MPETDTLDEAQVSDAFGPLEKLMEPMLVSTEDGNKDGLGALEHSWHFLQVYCCWGLRLPTDDADFRNLLDTPDLGSFTFVELMQSGTKLLKDSCATFLSDTFPIMVDVGNDLASFAESASNDDGEMFKIIVEMLEGEDKDPESAIDLIQSLADDAQSAHDKTKLVQKGLGDFKNGLTIGGTKVKEAKEKLDTNSKTNLDEMAELSSNDETVPGSLAYLIKAQEDAQDLYDHDVVVAATSPTYAWVVPWGTIAAVTVATVYGIRATEALEKLDEAKEAVKNANDDLNRAVNANASYTLANSATAKITKYTDAAIVHTTAVQNGWNSILRGLGDVSKEIGHTMTTTDEGEKLAKTKLVIFFLKRTEKKWRELAPTLAALTKAPYVAFEPNPISAKEAADEVRKEVAQAA